MHSQANSAKVLFDEEAAKRFDKDNSQSSISIDDYNPDEEGIDPVTIYRFQENSRRLERLKAEMSGIPITSVNNLPAPGSFAADALQTLDPEDVRLKN